MDFREEIAKRGKLAQEYLITKCNELIHPNEPLREAAMHYLKSGGKGFRPAMLQLVCGALGGDESKAISPATAIEAIHVSSLIHDDFMDQDETRRGLEAVWKKWNPTIAILAGDVLFGLAFSIVGDVEDFSYELKYAISNELGRIYTKLCEGQQYDISFETQDVNSISIEDVTTMQYLKTGVLFEFSCITGARIALNKMEDSMIDLIRNYAKLAGTAFQIQDDIIGLIGEEKEVGKPIGSDIKQGKRTLIAIHAFSHATEHQKSIMSIAFENTDASTEEVKQCLGVMEELGSIQFAKELAEEKAKAAIELTKKLPQNSKTEILASFAKYMVEREL
ncbi:MAG: polyprenyl synthetase family protein [Candidatus Kariarchaeaceae archaeon]|jgi:geranylgeranyl diphosphate synthase type I